MLGIGVTSGPPGSQPKEEILTGNKYQINQANYYNLVKLLLSDEQLLKLEEKKLAEQAEKKSTIAKVVAPAEPPKEAAKKAPPSVMNKVVEKVPDPPKEAPKKAPSVMGKVGGNHNIKPS